MNKTLFKNRGKIIIAGVILLCIGIFIYVMPRETDMYSALLDGIETHMGIKAKDIAWENVDFPLTSEDNKNWIESNKSPQAVEDTIRNKLSGYTVLEKGETVWTSETWDLWIHINNGTDLSGVYVKINENGIIAFYGGKTAIEYEIK